MKSKRINRLWSVLVTIGLFASLTLPASTPVTAAPPVPVIPEFAPDPLPGGTLDPLTIPKYVTPLVILPAMPKTSSTATLDYYEIAVREFQQNILPSSMNLPTTVWSYGSVNHLGSFNYPAFTIESQVDKAVRVKWINDLVDEDGNFLPHLLPVDQTLHWANPPGGEGGTDMAGMVQSRYLGPVPIVTHLHGGHDNEYSDGYPEAWYLPNAENIPPGFATVGSKYNDFKEEAETALGVSWDPGTAVFQYPNDQRATTLWYHDHSLGMTRVNVYAGPAGFYLLRGGSSDLASGVLPGPAPKEGDAPGTKYYEIPIVIQERSFNADGSLFYPDNRAFFEGLTPPQLQIPFIDDPTLLVNGGDPSDVPPIWNPEFFGNTQVVNGKTWPYLNVEQRRYRLRFLNGNQSRFLILTMSDPDVKFYQIGTEGGFLPEPVELSQLLIGPAERADVIVDFTGVEEGAEITLQNIGPDEPFGGGIPGVDFSKSNADTTGQVMKFIVGEIVGEDESTPIDELELPPLTALDPDDATNTQYLSLNEASSETVWVKFKKGAIVEVPSFANGAEPFGPTMAMLGTVDPDTDVPTPLRWGDDITENPALGATEIWELHNHTEDAHPIHIHFVMFQVIEREDMMTGEIFTPEPWETGFKDTVISYPGQITRVIAVFDVPGLTVWHCHILEHEDNEMMRPYFIGAMP